jgi:hypothetical protein
MGSADETGVMNRLAFFTPFACVFIGVLRANRMKPERGRR